MVRAATLPSHYIYHCICSGCPPCLTHSLFIAPILPFSLLPCLLTYCLVVQSQPGYGPVHPYYPAPPHWGYPMPSPSMFSPYPMGISYPSSQEALPRQRWSLQGTAGGQQPGQQPHNLQQLRKPHKVPSASRPAAGIAGEKDTSLTARVSSKGTDRDREPARDRERSSGLYPCPVLLPFSPWIFLRNRQLLSLPPTAPPPLLPILTMECIHTDVRCIHADVRPDTQYRRGRVRRCREKIAANQRHVTPATPSAHRLIQPPDPHFPSRHPPSPNRR